jgi:prophage maintenance system killer protein
LHWHRCWSKRSVTNVIPGPWRAAIVYFAIVDIHGFFDGNGRLARFLANLELERAGFRPIILTDRAMRSGTATLTAVRELNDLEPLVDLFARSSAETTALLPSLVVGAELAR